MYSTLTRVPLAIGILLGFSSAFARGDDRVTVFLKDREALFSFIAQESPLKRSGCVKDGDALGSLSFMDHDTRIAFTGKVQSFSVSFEDMGKGFGFVEITVSGEIIRIAGDAPTAVPFEPFGNVIEAVVITDRASNPRGKRRGAVRFDIAAAVVTIAAGQDDLFGHEFDGDAGFGQYFMTIAVAPTGSTRLDSATRLTGSFGR